MRAKVAFVLGLVALLAAVPLAGCGEEEGQDAVEAVEGEPLELGELIYNVAITRFLNPALTSDAEYLVGQEPEPPGRAYLGVFLLITNENDDEAVESAGGYEVTRHQRAHLRAAREREPRTRSRSALRSTRDSNLPAPDTTAAEGADPGRDAALPGRRRRLREPAARARDRLRPTAPASSSSTSRPRWAPGSRSSRCGSRWSPPPLASVAVMTALFSDAVRYACVGVVALAAAATVSERRRPGGGWWTLFGAGARALGRGRGGWRS